MTQWHSKSKKKRTGGIRKTLNRCDKKLAWKGGDFAATHITPNEEEREKVKTRGKQGRNEKTALLKARYANVIVDSKANKMEKFEIVTVKDNPANKEFARRNIITKGAVIEVKNAKGENQKVRVTSRPGQSGVISAIVLK